MVVGGGRVEPPFVSSPRAMVSRSSSDDVELSSEEKAEAEEGAGDESEVSESEREGRLLSVDGVVSLKGPRVLRLRDMIDDIEDEHRECEEGITSGDVVC
jgi:hypothetical protein